MTYHVIKIQIEGSKSPSSDIVNGVVLPGITSTSYNNKHAIGLGDIYDGPCSSSFREKVINKIVEGVTWGNRTISLVGEGDVGGEEVDYLLRKGGGPEVLRIGFEGVKNSEVRRLEEFSDELPLSSSRNSNETNANHNATRYAR